MAGLLGQSPLAGLLAMVQQPQPVEADAGDMLLASRYEQRQAALPAIPQRGQPSALGNAFRFLVGGQEGLAADRAARLAEANAPALAEQKQRLADMVAQLPDYLQVAYATNPEEVGKALASNAEGYSLSAGGLRGGLGGIVASAPTYSTVGDTIFSNDRGTSKPVAVAAPSFADITARTKAETDAELGRDRLAYDYQNAGSTLSPGQQRRDINGNVVAENTNATPQQVAAQQKREDERVKALSSLESINAKVEDTGRAVDTALSQVGNWTAGLGSSLAVIPGTPAADLKSTIDTIEANLSFNALAEMRANSPTGGALGGIAVRELELLGATVASLRQSQSPEQLRRNLATIKASLSRLKSAQQQAYNQRFSGSADSTSAQSGAPIRVTSVAQARALPSGTRFIDPNGVERVVP